jgi:hypothetical protein
MTINQYKQSVNGRMPEPQGQFKHRAGLCLPVVIVMQGVLNRRNNNRVIDSADGGYRERRKSKT